MAKLKREYGIRAYYPQGANKPDPHFELEDDITKVVAKAAATERFIDELKYKLWPKIFEQVQRPADKLLWKLYEHKPHGVCLYVRERTILRKRVLTFYVGIEKVEGAHSNVAGKFVGEIFIGNIRVYYNDTMITEFESPAGACKWTFLC